MAQHKKSNAVLAALTGQLAEPQGAEVVQLTPPPAAPQSEKPAPAEPRVRRPQAKSATPVVPGKVKDYKRVGLYLPPAAKRKLKEIALAEDKKEHDLHIEILREYLKKKGFDGLL